MDRTPQYRLRKVSDIDRDYPLFELLDGETILADFSLSNAGELEIAFHPGIQGRVTRGEEILEWFKKGKMMALNKKE